jgi:coenzyme F420-0:L-glutamate ligase / coenzyme F420-1:gamma-L-glutamate ligase
MALMKVSDAAMLQRAPDNSAESPQNEVFAAVKGRRSVRRYLDRSVPDRLVADILEAATWAPSPHNRQPWRFVVLRSRSARVRLADAMGERLRADRRRDGDSEEAIEAGVARSRERLRGAPIVIVAALSMAEMDAYADGHRRQAEFLMAVQATAAAAQTILLLAEARGLGSCWMCAPLFCPDVVSSALDLPTDWEPQALITLGFPASPGRLRPRRPIGETVRWVD